LNSGVIEVDSIAVVLPLVQSVDVEGFQGSRVDPTSFVFFYYNRQILRLRLAAPAHILKNKNFIAGVNAQYEDFDWKGC